MVFRKLKRVTTFIIFALVLICGYVFYKNSQYVAYSDSTDITDSKVLAKVGDKEITQEDIKNYKDSNQSDLLKNLTDKDILNKLIEDNVLIKAAKDKGVKVTKSEVEKIIDQSKALIEKGNAKSGDNKMDTLAKDLGLTLEKYWSTYALKAYASVIAIAKEKEGIKSNIISEISKNHPNLSSAENEKSIKAMYQKKIEELKKKYAVEIFN